MDEICRLCCSTNFVNNNIFDEENALYIKMSLYLPIKVYKNDRLPQMICDKCSCKVNDFYQFCNETIEVQNRLRSMLLSSIVDPEEKVDLARIKQNTSPPPCNSTRVQSTQTDDDIPSTSNNDLPIMNDIPVKEEPRTCSPIKEETSYDDYFDGLSENSDEISLITLKERKISNEPIPNGVEKRGRNKKSKLQDLEILMNALPEGTNLEVVDGTKIEVVDTTIMKASVKEEVPDESIPELDITLDVQNVKSELVELEAIHCCICMMQYYSKSEMIQHYKEHGRSAARATPPPAPPLPDHEPTKCPRCKKCLPLGEWAAHWRRHWERDSRPYRCSLCEKAFHNPQQILKHGQTHQKGAEGHAEPRNKRFICDLCPEGFVYMRYLQAHRTRAHPEAAARALALRCAQCAATFAHLNSLRRHLRAHSGERNHLCNVCGKALTSREHLKFHIRIHTGYKPHVCKTCGKGFVKKCNLTLHERVHSGERPHVCAHCGKAFSQRSSLVIHERYHSGARPYVCELCGRGFVARGLLSVHLKTKCI